MGVRSNSETRKNNFVKIKDLFKKGTSRLKKGGVPEPELETSLLLAHLLNIDRPALLLNADQTLQDDQIEKFENFISRRAAREPLAYIVEEKEFWSLPFKVSPDVLIPRPETELLIEKALATFQSKWRDPEELQAKRILDLGTGSGIIAVVLALKLPLISVTALDLSYRALKVAKLNAKRHKVQERIHFVNSDWFGGLSPEKKYDLVLANPPYIANQTLDRQLGDTEGLLQPEVVNYEPHLALDGGELGLHSIGRIAGHLGNILKPCGWFFMEIGSDQEVEVKDIFRKTGQFDSIAIHKDLAGLPRILQARKH